MKHTLTLITGALLVAVATGSYAQTAVTDPVGYITMNAHGGTLSTPGESYIGAPLVGKLEFKGLAVSASGTTINVAAGALTAAAYDQQTGGPTLAQGPRYYIEVTNGAGEGVWTDIVSNTASTVVTTDNISAMVSATSVLAIRKHQTISSLFGATNQAGLLASDQYATADNLIIVQASSTPPGATTLADGIFYNNDPFDTGWRGVSSGSDSLADVVVPPHQGIYLKHKAAGILPIIQVGHVKTGKTVYPVEIGENFITIPLATGTTLGGSNIGLSVTRSDQYATADQVTVQNKTTGAFSFNFFNNDPFSSQNWEDVNNTPTAGTVLAEGQSVRILNTQPVAGNTAYNVTFPKQEIAP